MPKRTVKEALTAFVERQQLLQHKAPQTPFDPEWASPCYSGNALPGELISWKPVAQTESSDMFSRLEDALEIEIHQDLIDFYSQYWSDPLPALFESNPLNLLQAWNNDDLERLRGNLIGHALSKQKQRQPLTLFFACTEPDGEYFLSVENESGQILLEAPGKPPIRKISDSLAEFIDCLEPLTIQDTE
ncbi:SecY-interacting protein [Marinobacterium jannaschii]|uniref:SecY-interacting protein n=1 Tax=Marinobacterium jannaschii TaxID=64970 RepID=UPI00056039AF|nr:SecY-interacting protein [Marinobacterium jannaschii]